ncbi:CopG family transcriptional regulator [Sphingobium yanoikuyae]|uniref:CopG family transcriptional regulator n=1 Tax=Sphingobium yanoikuyae TaxID=13690 RepID=A0AA42X423_SPHYA|nr:CopG family transcriptional regulator [Sphingobium yanoikuyae]MDH2135019.1 CopG family transcriptional regulator [Sphingobium yanoikuyae]MDH2170390.1 CopG family transcriptional regulator [Sphingobium yanoikuyae]
MPKVNFRLDGTLHTALMRRARGANLSLSAFIRQALKQAVDERRRYVFSSQDEILATSIQILSIVATSVGQQSPKALEQGMAQARSILAERGLLGGEDA